MGFYKLTLKLTTYLFAAVQCFHQSQDCQLPVQPIYGWYQFDGSEVIYNCREGYGLLGHSTRHCVNGKWNYTSPVCVRAATAAMNDRHLTDYLTDNDVTTCASVQKRLQKITYSSLSLKFWFDNTFSSAIVRVVMTSYGLGLEFPIYINGDPCDVIVEAKSLYRDIVSYKYNCSLLNIKSDILEIRLDRSIRSSVCEIQILPIKDIVCSLSELYGENITITFDPEVNSQIIPYGTAAIFKCSQNAILRGSEIRYCIEGGKWSGNQTFCEEVACPLSEFSKVNANITFHPEVSGKTATYGTAATYRCNKNTTLQVHYCIVGNKWSGNKTFCEVEQHGETSIITKYFIVIVSTSVAAGLIVIVIAISLCIVLRKKRVKPTSSSQDIQCYDVGTTRISAIDHYYNTANYDYGENGIRTSTDSEDYDYCTVNDTSSTIESSTNWKFAQFTVRKQSSPTPLIDNEIYVRD